MLKKFGNKYFLVCGLLPKLEMDQTSLSEYKEIRGLYLTDPWERVKCIFSKDPHGDLHPELQNALNMFVIGLTAGAFYGGYINSIRKGESFKRVNESTVYASHKDAVKAFANHNTMSFLNGAIIKGPVFGLFCSSFVLIASCCEAYRNRPSILDTTAAGVVVGGLSRLMYGIKGMISGAFVAGTLGCIYGVTLLGICKIGGSDQIELKHAQYAFSQYRKQRINDFLAGEKTHENLQNKNRVDPLNELPMDKEQPIDSYTESKNK